MVIAKPAEQTRNLLLPNGEPRQWAEWEVQEIMEIQDMLHGPVGIPSVLLLWGKQGSGKTMFMVWLGYKLRKYFGMPTVIDSPYMKPAYGTYTLMTDKDFIKEQMKIKLMVDLYEKVGRSAELEWEDLGIKLFRAAVLWDEAYSKISVHQTADKIAQLYNFQVLQYRHNQCVICIVSPDPNQINRQYSSKFATHEVSCTYHENYRGTGEPYSTYMIYNRTTKQFYQKELRVLKWGKLFKTGGVITPKVSFKKFKSADLDEIDELEILQWVEVKKGELNEHTT